MKAASKDQEFDELDNILKLSRCRIDSQCAEMSSSRGITKPAESVDPIPPAEPRKSIMRSIIGFRTETSKFPSDEIQASATPLLSLGNGAQHHSFSEKVIRESPKSPRKTILAAEADRIVRAETDLRNLNVPNSALPSQEISSTEERIATIIA